MWFDDEDLNEYDDDDEFDVEEELMDMFQADSIEEALYLLEDYLDRY